MAKPLWEWKPRFAVALVVRGLLIVTSHIPIVTSLAVPSLCVVTQTPMGANSGTKRRKRKFPLVFCKIVKLITYMIYAVVVITGIRHSTLCLFVPAGAATSGRATAGTTRAVPDCSTNHSNADRIVVNSYSEWVSECLSGLHVPGFPGSSLVSAIWFQELCWTNWFSIHDFLWNVISHPNHNNSLVEDKKLHPMVSYTWYYLRIS